MKIVLIVCMLFPVIFCVSAAEDGVRKFTPGQEKTIIKTMKLDVNRIQFLKTLPKDELLALYYNTLAEKKSVIRSYIRKTATLENLNNVQRKLMEIILVLDSRGIKYKNSTPAPARTAPPNTRRMKLPKVSPSSSIEKLKQ